MPKLLRSYMFDGQQKADPSITFSKGTAENDLCSQVYKEILAIVNDLAIP